MNVLRDTRSPALANLYMSAGSVDSICRRLSRGCRKSARGMGRESYDVDRQEDGNDDDCQEDRTDDADENPSPRMRQRLVACLFREYRLMGAYAGPQISAEHPAERRQPNAE